MCVCVCVCVCVWCVCVCVRERERERERERTQNSELYYTRIKILGSCLFLQSVPANLHASRLHINNSNNIDYRSNDEKDDSVRLGGKGKKTRKKRQR